MKTIPIRAKLQRRAYWLYSTVAFMLSLSATGQNLVFNPGFDQYSVCPDFLSQLYRAPGWFTPTHGSPDLFNNCNSTSPAIGIPENQFGVSDPFSGNGYAGFYALYSNVPDPQAAHYREYLAGRLIQPLQPGETYQVSFRMSLSDYSHVAVNRLGILFCNDSLLSNTTTYISQAPQLEFHRAGFWKETKDWIEASGCFTADSAYRFLVIGNFRNEDSTVFIHLRPYENKWFSYYFIDQVSVEPVQSPYIGEDTSFCGNGILEASLVPPHFQVRWNTGVTGVQLLVTEPGWYYADVLYGGCSLRSDSIFAGQHSLPLFHLPEDTLVDLCMGPAHIFPQTTLSNLQYTWDAGSSGAGLIADASGEYTLVATDSNGCSFSDTISVWDACYVPIYIPDAFTPNHDGINDGFTVYGTSIEEFHLSLYNRWGEAIAQLDNHHPGWSGDHYPEGIYAWKLEAMIRVEDKLAELHRDGHVMLLR